MHASAAFTQAFFLGGFITGKESVEPCISHVCIVVWMIYFVIAAIDEKALWCTATRNEYSSSMQSIGKFLPVSHPSTTTATNASG
jgi:hypothetical protein